MKAYIFDLDGTLFDSMGVWEQVDIDYLQKRGITIPPGYAKTIAAKTFQEAAVYTIERFALNDSVDGLMREWTDMAAYAYGHTVQMKPHAREFITALKKRGAKLAVATSLSPQLYEPALRGHGIIDLFDAICCSDEVGRGKSRPDIFLLAARKLGAPPGDCIVFEDILAAVLSAKSAGMTVCAVYDESSKDDWERIKETADYAILDWKEAPYRAGH